MKKLLLRQWLFHVLGIKSFTVVVNKDKVEPLKGFEHLCFVEKQFIKLKNHKKFMLIFL